MSEILYTNTTQPSWEAKEPATHIFKAGHVKASGHKPCSIPTILEADRRFPMRDGVRIVVDIFRPRDATGPVPAIINWSPYGKTGSSLHNLYTMPYRCGVPLSSLSGYESWEGLDPFEWVNRGYAIINANARGAGDSEGDIRYFGTGEGRDGHDLTEAIAALPWCNGKIAFAGNSWLAMAQWFIAAEQPAHLACIAPLEGTSDFYREIVARGGIPATPFVRGIAKRMIGRERQEDAARMLAEHPLANDYWNDKRARIDKITVPAYVLASYSSNLHTVGSFHGFEAIQHTNKWLTVHATQEWHDLYSSYRTTDLARFFDRYLKGIENGWETTPRIRMAYLRYNQAPEFRSFDKLPWHEPTVSRRVLFLGSDGSLVDSAPASEHTISYQSDVPAQQTDNDEAEVRFTHTFHECTTITGPSKAVLYIAALEHNDIDVFVQIRKANASGELLQNLNIPLANLGVEDQAQIPMTNVMQYLGPPGTLRASMRKVSQEISSPTWPTLAHDEPVPVSIGEVVRLEVMLWPTGIVFDSGEQLVLKVSGHEMGLVDFESLQGSFHVANKGRHELHFGGDRASYLELNTL